ncbi:hypothetical protein QTP70_024760, partial [Hemibagrus guttatus]
MDLSSSPPDPFRDLVETLRQALAALPAPTATSANTVTASSAPLYVSPMAQPAPYSGSVEDCNGFILQCSLVLEMQPHLYTTERSKVTFIISQLCGQALLWAESLWSQNSSVTQSYAGFVDHFTEVFGKPSWDSVGEEICRLQQGKLAVPEYALQFGTLAVKSGWNEQALLAAYRQGLNPQVRLHLAAHEDAIGLERLIQLSIRVAARMQSCVDESQDQLPHNAWRDRPAPASSPEPAPEPMHLGTSHLTPAEWQRRLTQNLCLYCGAPGHALPVCPIRPTRPMVSTIFPFLPQMKPLTTHGTVSTNLSSVSVVALLDSGSAGNFISGTLCRQLRLRTKATATPYQIQRFIRNYSSITNPLTSLLRNKPKALAWSPATEEAFKILKKAFTTAPLLIHPDPNKLFIVEVDASTTGVGVVLSQQQGNPSRLHPCAFFSHKLNPAERNYDIGNRELLAVKLALEEWRHWLEGAKNPFLVLIDHKNLEYLRVAKRLNPRQARWALFFTRFNFIISYRPGSKNTKADALSRMFALEDNPETPKPILPKRIIASPITWSEETLPPANASTNTPPGCPPGSQFIPRARRTALIHSAHTSLGTGHPGIHETLSLLKDRFWWPNMTADVRRYVQGCEECAMSKDPRHLPSGKLLPLPVPSHPWSHLGVDFVTDLPTSRNHTCIFVVVDRFSKLCRLLPLKGPPSALETAELIFNHVFRQTERKIQEISRYLRTFCHSHQNSWSQYLGWAEYAQNFLCQPSTGLTPFQCVLGYQPPLFPWSGEPSDVPAVDHWFRESERVWAPLAATGPTSADIRLRLPCCKLSPRFIGPFTILKQTNLVTYKLQLPPEPGDGAAEPPLPLLLDDGTTYKVKGILDSRHRGSQLEYLVDWEGYGPEERSWVARDDVLDPNLLEAFHAVYPHRPAPRGRGRPSRHRGPRPSGAGRREG